MKTAAVNCAKVISALCLFTLVSACGGGGGGSSGLSYSGSTSPASLSSSNSTTLLSDAYAGGNTGTLIGSIGTAASLTTTSYDAPRRPRSLALSETLVNFIRLSTTGDTVGTASTAAAVNTIPTNTMNGNCGGTATLSGSYDDASGSISITASFNTYCQDNTTLNGSIAAAGNIVTSSSSGFSISNIAITASNLTATMASGDSFTADGTLSIAPQSGYSSISTNSVITINMLLKDSTTSKVYKLANYQITETVTLSYNDIVITGRYFDPDEGYIDLSTPTTIRIMSTDEWPSSGSLKGTGNNGSATITALDNTTYQLDVNTATITSSSTGLWSAL